jgi:cytochrome c-type biogenesis protein CcmH/NrfG
VYIKELQQMVADEPEFIDGYAHLGHMYYQQGKPKKSLG